jgi:hypothetical protein
MASANQGKSTQCVNHLPPQAPRSLSRELLDYWIQHPEAMGTCSKCCLNGIGLNDHSKFIMNKPIDRFILVALRAAMMDNINQRNSMKMFTRTSSSALCRNMLLCLTIGLCCLLAQSGRSAPQTIGLNFTGATLADSGDFPPDSMGAVGPQQYIVAINGRIRSFNKVTGLADGALNQTMNAFFAPVMTPVGGSIIGNFTADPRIRYDRFTGRWFVVMIDAPYTSYSPLITAANRIMIAVSDAPVVTGGGWTRFQFKHDTAPPAGDTGLFADYPTLGVDANALYIGCNVFTSGGELAQASAFVVQKASILGAGPPVVTAFRNLIDPISGVGLYTPQGVDNFDAAATEGYFIGINYAEFGSLAIRRVANPDSGTPTISGNLLVTVPATSSPHTVPHLGNTGGANGQLDAVDDRLFVATIRNGRLWTAHNIYVDNTGNAAGTQTRNGCRWYELQNLNATPGLVQSGTVVDPTLPNDTSRRNYWIPSIMVSGQGHVAMGFSVAGANERINAGTVGRLAGDPLGTMQAPILCTASTTAYNPPGDPGSASGRRWGDYSYTCVDPDDDMTMWTIQEFCDSANSWGVRVARLLAPPPATPASASPASVQQAAVNVNVVITGTPVNGSGFFDPGAGFANHITATVNGGGVFVDSVTYTDPTHITLNITVLPGAPAGARTITVTNPDGQTATSASGILTVTTSSVKLCALGGGGDGWTGYPFLNGGGSQQIFSTTSSINTMGLQNPAPEAVYRHLQLEGGGMTWVANNLSPGTYKVRVHLSSIETPYPINEIRDRLTVTGANGSFWIDVSVYGSGGYNQAMIEQFPQDFTPNASGQISGRIDAAPGYYYAVVSGVEVVKNP